MSNNRRRVIEILSDDEAAERRRKARLAKIDYDPKTYKNPTWFPFSKKWDGDDYSEDSFP